MRSDYALYGVAIICFIIAIIAGALMAYSIQGYTLSGALGISMITIFVVLGIISTTVGYSTRPRAIMPPTQPTPASTAAPAPKILPPSVTTPPPPTEEVTPEPSPTAPPAPPQPVETAVTPLTEPERPMEVAEAEQPKEKPTRRRRKKAQ